MQRVKSIVQFYPVKLTKKANRSTKKAVCDGRRDPNYRKRFVVKIKLTWHLGRQPVFPPNKKYIFKTLKKFNLN